MAFCNPPPIKPIDKYNFNCDLYNYEEILEQLKEKPTKFEDEWLSWDEKNEIWTFSLDLSLWHFIREFDLDKLLIRLLHAFNHFRINLNSTKINFRVFLCFLKYILGRLELSYDLKSTDAVKLSAYNLLVVMDKFIELFRVSKIFEDKGCRFELFNVIVDSFNELCRKNLDHGGDVVNVMLHHAAINLRRHLDAVGRIIWHMTNDWKMITVTKNVAFTENFDEFKSIDNLWFKDPFTKCTIKGNEVTLQQSFFYPYPYTGDGVYANLKEELPNSIQKSCYSHKLEQIEVLHEICKNPEFQEEYWKIISNHFDFCSRIADSKIKYYIERAQSNSLSNQNQEDLFEEDFIFAVLILAMKCLVKLVNGNYKKQIPSILRHCFKVLNFLQIPDIVLKVPLNSVLLLSYFTHQLMKAVDQDKQILREIPADVVATIAMITYWVTKDHSICAFVYTSSGEPITKSLPIIEKVKHAD